MRAVVLDAFGPPANLRTTELEDPAPGAGEVVVDVAVAGITFVETQLRAGRPPHPSMLPELPVVLGNGVGGVVVAAGDGVDPAMVGRRVVCSLRGRGGYAEQALAPAEALLDVPGGLDLRDAVAVLADGRTALLTLRGLGLAPGVRVLVLPAAGGVGTLLVQLASDAGAVVIGVARGARKIALVRSLGAAETADSGSADWAAGVEPVDVVVDGVGGADGRAAFERLRRGGRYARLGMASGGWAGVSQDEAAERGVTLTGGPPPAPEELRRLAAEALAAVAAGRLRPVVGQTFPLERAADAHAAIEARETVGKTLLLVGAGGR